MKNHIGFVILIMLTGVIAFYSFKNEPQIIKTSYQTESVAKDKEILIDQESYDEYMASRKYKKQILENGNISYSRADSLYKNPDGYELKGKSAFEIEKDEKEMNFRWEIEKFENTPFNFKANISDVYGKDGKTIIRIIRSQDKYEIARLTEIVSLEYAQSVGYVSGCPVLHVSSQSDSYEISVDEIYNTQYLKSGSKNSKYQFSIFKIIIKNSDNKNIVEEAMITVSINSNGEISTAFKV